MNWYSVKDRLPESGRPVLFWHKRAREVYFGSYEVDEWLVGGRHYDASGVTHWQPLPLPPGHTDAAPLRKALERAWMLLDRGASREQAIGVIADALGLNELPNDRAD